MNKRQFLKGAAALAAIGTIHPVFATTQVDLIESSSDKRRFLLTQKYQLKAPEGSHGRMNLWIPIPEDVAPFQKVVQLQFDGNAETIYLTSDNAFAAKTLFASWPDSQAPMYLELTMLLETSNWEPVRSGMLSGYQVPEGTQFPAEVLKYLNPTAHIPTTGFVKAKADEIVGGETNPLIKARLLYDWTAEHMERDNSVIGCGTGDVEQIFASGKLSGKCTDISSVFVALARAAGIPAREMFGIRLGRPGVLEMYSQKAFGSADESGSANISEAQHCRAQFYLAGFGWVPCDPADVTKMRLTEGKVHQDPAVQAVNDYLFGNWDMNWIGFNYGRDFDLSPVAEQTPLNNFGYPYAEVDGDPLNYYDPKNFAYEFISREQK